MDALMEQGSHTMRARAVMPTSSSPNWASMIMGARPEQHGITSNDWQPDKFDITPTAKGTGGIFPSVMDVLRAQQPAAHLAIFHDWSGFGRLFERSAVNYIEDSDGPTNAARHAVAYFKNHQPDFTFIHLDHVDHAGHADGHGSPAYYASVEVADELIGEVWEGLRSAGMMSQTVVIVTADHGGIGKGHGGGTMAEIEIPWIISGPGVRPNHELKTPVNTYDTAVTAAWVFKLETPDDWIGKPVREAFLD